MISTTRVVAQQGTARGLFSSSSSSSSSAAAAYLSSSSLLPPPLHHTSFSLSSSSSSFSSFQCCTFSSSSSSDNITYSGGHASSGQGGYYGSGGARAKAEQDSTRDITQEQRSKVLAISSDVQAVQQFLEELEQLEDLLREEEQESGGKVTGRSEELRSKRKHLVSNRKILECLDRLQIEGAPVWGLSSEEHDMVVMARERVKSG